MMKGTVKWFDPRKGYGFILGEDGTDYFVHYTAIVQEEGFRTLRGNAPVTFEAHTDGMGRTLAANVAVDVA